MGPASLCATKGCKAQLVPCISLCHKGLQGPGGVGWLDWLAAFYFCVWTFCPAGMVANSRSCGC